MLLQYSSLLQLQNFVSKIVLKLLESSSLKMTVLQSFWSKWFLFMAMVIYFLDTSKRISNVNLFACFRVFRSHRFHFVLPNKCIARIWCASVCLADTIKFTLVLNTFPFFIFYFFTFSLHFLLSVSVAACACVQEREYYRLLMWIATCAHLFCGASRII